MIVVAGTTNKVLQKLVQSCKGENLTNCDCDVNIALFCENL